MALMHAQPLEAIDLHKADDSSGATVSRSLLRSPRLQLLRVVLEAGDSLPKHHVSEWRCHHPMSLRGC